MPGLQEDDEDEKVEVG